MQVEQLTIENATEQDWQELTLLFEGLHSYMGATERGLNIELISGGAEMWVDSLRLTLKRFGTLVVARNGAKLVGFGYGAVKLGPAHLGSVKVGSVEYFFLKDSCRGGGVGGEMIQCLQAWFSEQKVHSVELEVTAGNMLGQEFWKYQGFKEELIQYRKFLK